MRKETIVYGALTLVIIYALFWIVLGAYYCYPTAEDIEVAAFAIEEGLWRSTITTLNTFDGRYTTNVLHGLNPLAFGWYYGHKIMPVITFLLFCYAVYFYLNTCFYYKSRTENGLFAIVIGTIFFSLTELSNTLYWMIVTFVYTYSIILFLFSYSFFLKFSKSNKTVHLLLSQLFLFLSLGCNELFMIPVGVFLLYLLVKYFKHPLRNTIISLFLVYIASCLFFVTSPGIANRIELFEEEKRELFTGNIANAVLEFTLSLFRLVSSISFFFFLMLFLSRYKIRVQKSVYIIISLFLILFTTEAILIGLIGNNGFPERTVPFFLPFAILIIMIALSRFSDYFVRYRYIILVLFIITFFWEQHAFNDIKADFFSGKLDKYKKVMDYRYQILSRSDKKKCQDILELPKIGAILPSSIATHPIIYPNRSAVYWNLAYERYFDVDEVRLEGDTTSLLYDKFKKVKF